LLSADRYWAPNFNLSARGGVVCPILLRSFIRQIAKAEDVRQRLLKMQYLIKISGAVIALKTEAGPVKLNELVNTAAMAAE
jgi:uncharacterized membrane protein